MNPFALLFVLGLLGVMAGDISPERKRELEMLRKEFWRGFWWATGLITVFVVVPLSVGIFVNWS